MSGNVAPIFEAIPITTGTQFTDADTTTKKTICTAGANGARVDAISVCTDDTSEVDLAIYRHIGATDYYIGVVTVPAGSGYTSVAKVDGLSALVGANLDYLPLGAAETLKAACVATMTAAKVTDLVVESGNY